MLQTLAITGPIYLVIALGFGAVRFGVFGKADMRVLGTYVVRFALPALVFTALSQRPMSEIMNGRYLVGYAVASLAVMMGALFVAWRGQGKGFTLSALIGLGVSSSNSGFIGYPIAILVAGPSAAAVGLAMCMLVENLLMIPLTLVMADSGHAAEGKWHRILVQSLKQLSRNPVILSILGGFAVSMTGLPITGVLARSINMLAMSSAAVSLFVIGGTLVGLKTAGMRRDVSAIAGGKLLLHPLAVGLMMWLLPPAEPSLRAAAVVFAAVPMLSIYPIIAQRYGYEDICAAAQLLTTTVAFVTISVVLWLLGSVVGWV